MANKGSKLGLMFLGGLAAGYVASLFVSDKTKKQHKQTLQDFQALLTNPERQEAVKAAFKSNSAAALKNYQRIQKELSKNLSDLRVSIEKLDKQKYTRALNQALQTVADKQEIPQKQLEKLKTYLVEDYQLLKQNFKKPTAKS